MCAPQYSVQDSHFKVTTQWRHSTHFEKRWSIFLRTLDQTYAPRHSAFSVRTLKQQFTSDIFVPSFVFLNALTSSRTGRSGRICAADLSGVI